VNVDSPIVAVDSHALPEPVVSRRFPFPANPTVWYRIAFAGQVRVGEITSLSYFGMELIAFRTDDGAVHVMEAYCPHLGAHIGVGGCISDGLVVCPFHNWKYDTEGRNVDIPYRDEVNRKARLRTFEARDWAGLVMVWFDEGGAPPDWQLPDLPEFHDETLVLHEPEEARWRIRSHPQEILENTVDIAHFLFIHGASSFGELTVLDDGPMLRATSELTFPTARGPMASGVENEMWGLGIDINRVLGVGPNATILTVTPIDGEHVGAAYMMLLPRGSDGEGISGYARALAGESIRQFEADFPIWENKVHRPNPSLAIGEAQILRFRRWADRFYASTG